MMRRHVVILALLFFYFGNVTAQVNSSKVKNVSASTSDLKVLNFEELQSYLKAKDDHKTYVLNFWATWCAPCVKELPYFETLNANYSNENVEVILVSLDFPKQIETKLKTFLETHALKSEVVVLNDVDANTWIPKVNADWTGAIPATVIYNNNKTAFYERSFDYQELEKELKHFIK